MKNVIKELIKNSSIIGLISAAMLSIGFISQFAESRVLGLPFGGITINSYIENSGKFFLQTSQAFYNFPLYFDYIYFNIPLLFLFIFLFSFLTIPFEKISHLFFHKLNEIRRNTTFIQSVCVINIIFFFLILISILIPFFKVKSVIQPTKLSELLILEQAKGIISYEKHPNEYIDKVIDQYVIEKFCDCKTPQINKIKPATCLFDWKGYKNNVKRKETYFTIIQILFIIYFILLIVSVTIRLNNIVFQKQIINIVICCFIPLITSLSYIHGVLGADYTYPVVNVTYKNGDKDINHLIGVFMINNNGTYATFLDRSNYVSFFELPYANIISVTNIYNVSPFENCTFNKEGVIKLCEEISWR